MREFETSLDAFVALGDDYEVWCAESREWRKYRDSCYAPRIDAFPEPDKAEGRIMSISMKVFKGESLAFGLLPKPDAPELENVTYFQCHSEKDMLSKFLLEFRRISPHIFTGWNVYGFDIPYLVNRLNNVFGENYRSEEHTSELQSQR